MKNIPDVIAERILDIIKHGVSHKNAERLDSGKFPPEYKSLIDAVNTGVVTANARVLQEQNRLEMINDLIQSGMWSMEFDGSKKLAKVFWSQAFRRMLGFENQEDFPDTLEAWTGRIHPEDRERVTASFWNAVEKNLVYDEEYRAYTKDNELQWFRDKGEAVPHENGFPFLFIGTFVNTTKEKEKEVLIQENLEAKNQLEASKKELEFHNDILTALSADYISIYRVNFQTGFYEIFKITDRLRGEVADSVRKETDYYTALQNYIDTYVEESDQEYLRKVTSRDYMLAKIKEAGRYSVRYRVKDNKQGHKNFEIHFVDAERNGTGNFLIVAFRNVDSLIQKEQLFRQETLRNFEETLEGAGIGIWRIELEKGLKPRMYTDSTMRRLLGCGDSISPEACYTHWFDRIEHDYVKMVKTAVKETLAGKRTEVVYPWHHPELGRIFIRCGSVKETRFDRPGDCLKGYHQDITQTMLSKKEQEKKLMEALLEAKHANRAKTEFLSHMSHDIRTPINGILGMLAIEEKNPDDKEFQKDCRAKIRMSAEHLLSLINDVLDISKLENGRVELSRESFSLPELLDNCVYILISQSEERGLDVVRKPRSIEHPRLIGSPLHLRQILLNIMSNAIKYNKPGGKITLQSTEIPFKDLTEEEQARLEKNVKGKFDSEKMTVFRFTSQDTGIGISRDFLEHVFDPFTQEKNDARTKYGGSGLGMAISQKLAEKMGGWISVESEQGVGSTFSLTIPFEIDTETKEEEPLKNDTADGNADISGMKILLAEDNDLNREIVVYILEEAGAVVVQAENGREAADIFSKSSVGEFSCILMDIMMPVLNGLDAAREIRAMDRQDASTVPVIALTASVFSEDVQKAKEAGMNEHLAKPLDFEKLLMLLSMYKDKKTYR